MYSTNEKSSKILREGSKLITWTNLYAIILSTPLMDVPDFLESKWLFRNPDYKQMLPHITDEHFTGKISHFPS